MHSWVGMYVDYLSTCMYACAVCAVCGLCRYCMYCAETRALCACETSQSGWTLPRHFFPCKNTIKHTRGGAQRERPGYIHTYIHTYTHTTIARVCTVHGGSKWTRSRQPRASPHLGNEHRRISWKHRRNNSCRRLLAVLTRILLSSPSACNQPGHVHT